MDPTPLPSDPDDWQPATSAPGELYSPAGEMRSRWALLNGLKNRDPRNANYRRDMRRSAMIAVGLVIVIVVAISLVIWAISALG